MSDYGSDVVTRNRRWLPSEPNRHPISPTIPVAKLRLYRELAAGASRSLTDLPLSHYSSSHRTIGRPISVSSSSIPTPAPMDRVTLSYPGTPTKSNGYPHQQHYLHQHLSGSAATGIGYGRPSSINPSNQYSPDPYVQGTWSLGSHRQSAYQDRYYPAGTNYPTSYNPHHATGSYQQQRDLIATSPSSYARRNVALPIHSSSTSSATAAALAARSSALPGSANYRHHHHSDHDLRYINHPTSSYTGAPGYGSGSSYVQGQAIHRSSGYHPSTHAINNSAHYYQQYPYQSRTRHYRSESDLDALSNLYPYPADTIRTQPGVHSGAHGYHTGTMGPSVHQAYPSSSYYGQHHDPYQQSLEHSRYAQSNPYTIYPGYGQSSGTINATPTTATATSRYNRSLDRYY